MKKILLIGELNKSLKTLNDSLMSDFQVQVCELELENVKTMLKFAKPNLIVVSLSKNFEVEQELFEFLKSAKAKIPVFTIGKKQECEKYEEYYKTEQFTALLRPITQKDILLKCHERLEAAEKSPFEKKKESSDLYEEIISEVIKDTPKRHIMVVDDSALLLRSIKSLLEPRYQVSVAVSGKQALEFLPTKKPDLILLDYDMPNMNGKETFQKLKEDELGKNIPVIFLTGVANKEHIYAVLQLEPAGYILKPPAEDKLFLAIEGALEDSKE